MSKVIRSRFRWFWLLVLVGLLVRAVPLFFEYADPDHYYHQRMAEQFVQEQQVPVWDALSYSGRPYTYYPLYHQLLALPILLLGVDARTAYALTSLAFALVGLCAVYLLGARLFNPSVGLGTLAFLALTPLAFARTTVFSRPDGIALSLMALLVWLVLERRWLLIALVSLALAWVSLPYAVFAALVCALWALTSTQSQQAQLALTAFLFLVISLVYYASLPWPLFQFSSVPQTSEELKSLDLFSTFVFGGTLWVFAFLGVWKLHRTGKRLPIGLWVWVGLGLLSLALAIRNLSLAAVPLALLAGFGFHTALEKTKPYHFWLVGMVVVALLLQDGLYYQTFFEDQQVGSLTPALIWARQNTPPEAVFLSLWDRGHSIAGVARRKVVMDGYFEFAPQVEARHRDVMSVFYGSEGNARSVFKRWGVTHLLVDKKMSRVIPDSPVLNQTNLWPPVLDLAHDDGSARIYRVRD